MSGKYEPKYDVGDYESLYNDYRARMIADEIPEDTRTRRLAGARLWLDWCSTNGTDPLTASKWDVRELIEDHRQTWAEPTIDRRFRSVTEFYDWLGSSSKYKEKYDQDNPTDPIDINDEYDVSGNRTQISKHLGEDEDEKLAIKEDAVEKMVDAVNASKESTEIMRKLIIRLLWDTALRSKELSYMKWRDIDPENREIRVTSAKLGSDHNLKRRTVFYTVETQRLLKKWLVTHRSSKSPHADDSPYLLPTEQSGRMRPSTISRKVKEAAHKAEINEPLVIEDGEVEQWLITAHRLRHSRITQLANHTDMDRNTIRRMAGHSKIETTLGYVHQDWDSDREKYRRAVE